MKLNLSMCSKPLKDFPFYSSFHLSGYFCNKKERRKYIFQRSRDRNFKNPHRNNELSNKQPVKKLNLWEKTAVDKSAWIKSCQAETSFFTENFLPLVNYFLLTLLKYISCVF